MNNLIYLVGLSWSSRRSGVLRAALTVWSRRYAISYCSHRLGRRTRSLCRMDTGDRRCHRGLGALVRIVHLRLVAWDRTRLVVTDMAGRFHRTGDSPASTSS